MNTFHEHATPPNSELPHASVSGEEKWEETVTHPITNETRTFTGTSAEIDDQVSHWLDV